MVGLDKKQTRLTYTTNMQTLAGEETYGMLYFGDIQELGELPVSEIERVELFEELPTEWTYPDIQPILLQKISEVIRYF